MWSYWNMFTNQLLLQRYWETECKSVQVTVKSYKKNWNIIQSHSSKVIEIVSIQCACYLALVTTRLLKTSSLLCEVTEYLHIVDRRYLCSSWNSLSLCQDWNVVCTVTVVFLGPFSLKTPLNLSAVGMIREFLGHLTEEKIARVWFHQDSPTCHPAQLTVWAVPVFQRSHHFERTAPPNAVTHAIWMNWKPPYQTLLLTFHPWC